MLLTELSNRRGKEVLPGLANAAGSYDKDTQKLGRDLLYGHLSRQTPEVVKEKLGDELAEVRRAAVRVVVNQMPRLAGELIDLLADEQDEVRGAAHDALVKLSRGEDFGPTAGREQRANRRGPGKMAKLVEPHESALSPFRNLASVAITLSRKLPSMRSYWGYLDDPSSRRSISLAIERTAKVVNAAGSDTSCIMGRARGWGRRTGVQQEGRGA